jgi:diadenosine tetraphosphate (Ap4A) HIT family hydrolase
MRFDGAATRGAFGRCAFCAHAALDIILTETEHFIVLADNAPLVEGHLLIVPREHYACFGAIPATLDDELLTLKRRVARFCVAVYRRPIFFEHGVFGQTVYHAHLHTVPIGAWGVPLHALATEADGWPVHAQGDVRAWYAANGHYFYVESPIEAVAPMHDGDGGELRVGTDGVPPTEAAIFPPSEGPYIRVLTMLRERSNIYTPWQPQFARRMDGAPKMRALAVKWQAFAANER